MKNQLRRPNISAIALSVLGFINMVVALSAGSGYAAARASLAALGVRGWLATTHGALFAIGLLMLLAAALWTVFDVIHDRRVVARWEAEGRAR